MRNLGRTFAAELMVAAAIFAVGSAPASAAPSGTVNRTSSAITIFGTDQANVVSVTSDSGMFVVTSDTGLSSDDCTQVDPVTVECSPVSELIAFYGYRGGDSFTTAVSVHSELYGGAGRDTLTGSTVGDLIRGQDGNDTLRGRAGPDTLFGGQGTDACIGGVGADSLSGCE